MLSQQFESMVEHHKLHTVFIAGLAGEGKTTLAEYFADTAIIQRSNTRALVTIGRCNQQTSVDEAYLPFRDILSQLTGSKPTLLNLTLDPETTIWSKSILSGVGTALREYGPDLLGTFLPGAALPARALATALDKGYHSYTQGQAERPGLDFKKVAKQFTDTLSHIAETHPMLIILDDFQWADNLSVKLFDQLRISLAQSPILFIVTYRTDELDIEREGRPHPLKELVRVVRGDTDVLVITLDSANDKQAEQFMYDLLVAMNVDADESFAKALFKRTNGHPLLSVETLRYLQEAGHLITDESQRWHVASGFAWDKLPIQLHKLENLIESRLDRLTSDLREILNLASIEGQEFTAQVIMEVLGKDELAVLHSLSDELGRRHQLVTEIEEKRVGAHVLSTFRFVNATFYKTVYESINSGKRRLAHGKVARVLEKLYDSRTTDLAVRLEYHYGLALEPIARSKHLISIARQLYARTQFDDSKARYLEAAAIASAYGDSETLIKARMYYSVQITRDREERTDDAWAELITLLQEAEALKLEKEQAFILRHLGIIQSQRGQISGAVQKYMQSLELSKKLHDLQLQGDVITSLANRALAENSYEEAELLFKQRLKLAIDGGEMLTRLVALLNLSDLYTRMGDTTAAESFAQMGIELAKELHADNQKIGIMIIQSQIARKENRLSDAMRLIEQSLIEAKELGLTSRIRSALIAYAELLITENRTHEAVCLLLNLLNDKKLVSDDKNRVYNLFLTLILPLQQQEHAIDSTVDLSQIAGQILSTMQKSLS